MKRAGRIALAVAAAFALLAPAARADHDEDKEGYDHKDFSRSHLHKHFFHAVCDYPWTRCYELGRHGKAKDSTCCGEFERWRKPPHRTLEFFCAPVTTRLHYPELYPRNWHAGGTINVDY